MAENISALQDSTTDTDIKNGSEPLADPYLAWLVNLVNRGVFEPSVVLNIGGQTVFGQIESAESYFKGITESLVGTAAGGVSDAVEIAQRLLNPLAQGSLIKDKNANGTTHFIHLKNAVIYAGNAPLRVEHWRGLLKSVDGYSFGAFPFGK